MVAHLKLMIAKLRRDRFGPSAERSRRLLDQLELQLEELEATATEDEHAAEAPAGRRHRGRTSASFESGIRTRFENERAIRAHPMPPTHSNKMSKLLSLGVMLLSAVEKSNSTWMNPELFALGTSGIPLTRSAGDIVKSGVQAPQVLSGDGTLRHAWWYGRPGGEAVERDVSTLERVT